MESSFAERFNKVCDLHPDIPAVGAGRQTAIAKLVGVSQEAVRKWLAGVSEPRSRKMQQLAELLDVSFVYLATGHIQDIDQLFTPYGKQSESDLNALIDAAVEKDNRQERRKDARVELQGMQMKAEQGDVVTMQDKVHIQLIKGDKDYDALRTDILDGGTHAYLSLLRSFKYTVGWNKTRKCYTATKDGESQDFTVSSCRLVLRPPKDDMNRPKILMSAGVPFNPPFTQDVRSILAVQQLDATYSIAWDFLDVSGLKGKHDVMKNEAGNYSINDTEYIHVFAKK
jgi:transcriptional regulator with XRE-family HTH domain